MDDIIKKQMKDVTVPSNDVLRRAPMTPEPYIAPIRDDEGDRLGKNPFFKKLRDKELAPQNTKGRDSRSILWSLLFVLLLVLGFAIANYFASATIEIKPVARSVAIDSDFVAFKDVTGGELVFDSTTLSEEKIKEVPATIEKKIQKKASGKVSIFNSYNGESQRLIKNTRLESPDHKIFHIDQSVVVPGAKIVEGKTLPGSVNVLVYADVPGKEYNIAGLVDFTIPGFKGDPRYAKFKAMTIPGSPITGGFSGTVKVPSDEAIKATQEELKQDLKKIVIEKVRANIPADKSFFPGSVVLKFEEIPQDFTVTDTATVSMRATVSVFFFDTALLTKKIAELALPENDRNNPFSISNMSSFEFKFVDQVDNVVLSDLSKVRFHLGGQADFIGQIDSQKVRMDLAGKNKKDFSSIIATEKNIGPGTNAVVRPMWKNVFPSDLAKITVKITN